jgi:DNA polymerase-4
VARFLHADLDAFYASVEQLLHPELRGIPMAVGGGVVLAASYEARPFGVRSGMAVSSARRLCPHLTIVGGSFGRYAEFGDRVVEVFERYTPLVERISIDEAFLDVSGARRLFGDEESIARRIRADVRGEVGLPISVGVASTKHLAKVASAAAKPDGMLAVPVGGEEAFLRPLSVRALWGVGPVTHGRLAEIGVETVGDLLDVPAGQLEARIGRGAAAHLGALARNRDPRGVMTDRRAGSIGSQSAIRATTDQEELHRVLLSLAERVGRRLREKQRTGRTVTVGIRRPGPRLVSRAHSVASGISSTDALLELGRPLLDDAVAESDEPVTLVRIAVSHLDVDRPTQLELPVDDGAAARPGSARGVAAADLDRQIDAVRERYGRGAVLRGSLLDDDHDVPDEFRELAEKD